MVTPNRSLDRNCIINGLIESRNIFNLQTLEYDLMTVSSLDLDPTENFLLVGLSNGSVDLQGVQDPNLGTLDRVSHLKLSIFNLNRVQWNPNEEQFFSMLDNHNLFLVDPVKMRIVDRYNFNLKTNWSDWNPNDKKMIAVCGTESQTRLVDVFSGSSVQTIILGAKSGLANHRATRCLWSRNDLNCLFVGDNEGYLHVYDTRHSSKPLLVVGEERGQISGMSFTTDHNSIITSQGTENHLVQWFFDKCSLRPCSTKFKKREKEVSVDSPTTSLAGNPVKAPKMGTAKFRKSSSSGRITNSRRIVPLPLDAYIRCQFYVTDRHVFCPVPSRKKKSKELYIYDLKSGYRIKTLKSDEILCQGICSVTGLLPDSLVLYVGGRERLRVWSLDEDHQRKMEEKVNRYHTSNWDSD